MTLRCSECGDENWVACQPGDADGTPPAPGQTGDDQLAAAFDRWIELERDHAGSDEVDQLNIEDMQADIVGAVTDTPARPLAGWRAKARILDRLIEQAAREDDPIDDLAASLIFDLVREAG